jgi:cobalt-zinc-cadmium efflux system membrane fusion protein
MSILSTGAKTAVRYTGLLACVFGLMLCRASLAENDAGPHSNAHQEEAHASEHDEHASDHDHHEDHKDHEDHEDQVNISPDIAERLGIQLDQAGPATLVRQVTLLGELVSPPGHSAEVRARFPGVVKRLFAKEGDQVEEGERLAVVESDISLGEYEINAPVSGLIQLRSANVGELTGAEGLFTIVSDSSLWAELKIFSADRDHVRQGQPVTVRHRGHHHAGHILSVGPGAGPVPYRVARVGLTNTSSDMQPGDMVDAAVAISETPVALAVELEALQWAEGKTVVFIREGESRYVPRAVSIGRRGAAQVEILDGIEAGETYVSGSSYLLRADLEKSGAAHQH